MNINEIAKLAGVSRATVSRYLNQGYISEEKRERVQKVIRETGYTPSSHAQVLRTKKTKLVGVIIPKINSDSIARMVSGISRTLSEKGYRLLLAVTENDEKKELNYLQVFQENQVDGIILLGTVFTGAHKKLMKASKVPVVVLAQKLSSHSCVYQDEEGAAHDLTALGIRQGGRQWGYIGVDIQDEAVGTRRKKGFLEALKEAGLVCGDRLQKTGPFRMETGYEGARDILKTGQVDALFCATDTIAVGAMKYLKEAGKRIPQDIRVVGFGYSEISRLLTPRLTTVEFHYEESGSRAAELLTEAIEEETPKIVQKKMGYRIIQAETT